MWTCFAGGDGPLRIASSGAFQAPSSEVESVSLNSAISFQLFQCFRPRLSNEAGASFPGSILKKGTCVRESLVFLFAALGCEPFFSPIAAVKHATRHDDHLFVSRVPNHECCNSNATAIYSPGLKTIIALSRLLYSLKKRKTTTYLRWAQKEAFQFSSQVTEDLYCLAGSRQPCHAYPQ